MVITLGTPTEGASLANLASLFSGNEQLRSLIDIRKNDFLQLLNQTQSDVLQKRLDNRCAGIEFDAAYETKPVGPLIIVTKDCATANATRIAGDGWNKNHLQLPKPPNRADKVYEWVRGELMLCAEQQVRCRDATSPSAVCSTGDF